MGSAELKKGDKVQWTAGRGGYATGVVTEKLTHDTTDDRGRTHRASSEEPQYMVKNERTGKETLHRGPTLNKVEEGSNQ